MKEMYLCSDRLEKFQSMGENGQAVHVSALQLIRTLRLRKLGEVADSLAIPQVNEHGDRIDWYAPFTGQVIPWAAASESERQSALSQLAQYHFQLRNLSTEMSKLEGSDQRLFAQLLEKTVQFPDREHVWLVNGKPVISFWGFVNAHHNARIDPLDCLRPARPSVAVAPTQAPLASRAVPLTEHVVTRRGWWYRLPAWLRWLLPLLLLLVLALLLLRACAPSVQIPLITPGIPHISANGITAPELSLSLPHPISPSVSPSGEAGLSGNSEPGAGLNATGAPVPPQQSGDNAPQAASTLSASGEPQNMTGQEPLLPAEPAQSAGVSATAPESVATPAPAEPAQPGALTLPPEALAKGDTGFLNGRWHAGSGIQDQRTGKPLSLNYQIKDSQGEVKMTRGDGVTCRGPVNAGIESGQLTIKNQSEAQCSDGSVYKMPEVICGPGAQSIADCKGRYDANTLFPISIKQEAGQ